MERAWTKRVGVDRTGLAHYRRLLLLMLSGEQIRLSQLEVKHKLLSHKWTFYLAMEKYIELYPSLFQPPKQKS